ncbi:MAG: hypothetical protein K2O12_00090 [Muribaculaceae bacterium]|nr:hypothetical protein [Muribaculaceae bacterium]
MRLVCSCGAPENFTIKGTLAGGETQSLRFIYYADGALRTIPGAARDGLFEVRGSSKEPTVVDILSNDGHIVGRVYAVNGDKIYCSLNRMAPWEIELDGTDVNARWAEFIRSHADFYSKGDSAGLNKAVADYIMANPEDVLSTLLLTTSYDCHRDPSSATRLLEAISADARPMSLVNGMITMLAGVSNRPDSIGAFRYYGRHDTLDVFNRRKAPLTFLSFTDAPNSKQRADSIISAFRMLNRKYTDRRLQILDLSFDTDSFTWRRSIRPDSAKWRQGWLPGSVATAGLENAAIVRVPWFVVADSSGLIVYRGGALTEALDVIDRFLK